MSHIAHIQNNKQTLEYRFAIIRLIREFFWSKGFCEVETPLIVRLPGQEPYLSPMPIVIHNEQGKIFNGYLHTSPEYTMKKMLASGFNRIFSLTKCFRDYESFGGTHNPEFTMIEWYKTGADMFDLMHDTEKLILFIQKRLPDLQSPVSSLQRLSMHDLWKQLISIDLDDYLTTDSMRQLCKNYGFNTKEDEPFEDLFYRIFLNKIEKKLEKMGFIAIYDYPAQMAALAKLSEKDSRYAQRVEIYINGMELANGFSELTNPDEQRIRFEIEQKQRKKLKKNIYQIDEDFIEAVGTMPSSAGIALGVDRLVQILTGCKDINNVLVLPASELFLDT